MSWMWQLLQAFVHGTCNVCLQHNVLGRHGAIGLTVKEVAMAHSLEVETGPGKMKTFFMLESYFKNAKNFPLVYKLH